MTQPRPADDQDLLCSPDQFLSQGHLERLFNDFNLGLAASLPSASVFSHLVNGLRHAYMTEILALQREVTRQSERRETQLCELTEQHNNQLAEISQKEHTILQKPLESVPSRAALAMNILPADTTFLYACGRTNPRRDTLAWAPVDWPDWSQRFKFNVFRLPEIGTIGVLVCYSESIGIFRTIALLNTETAPPGWKHHLQFYAFGSQQPNTEMISVGRNNDPERCIYARGDHVNKLAGWDEIFTFWVPL